MLKKIMVLGLMVASLSISVSAVDIAENSAQLTPTILQTDVQQYTHQTEGQWVKYSGALGFGYPYKVGTQAVKYNGVVYYTYSKCITTTSTNYMIVFVADSLGNKTVVRRIYSTKCDPHENASLHIDEYGFITVAQSARGKWRKGYVYKSARPEDISSFEQIDSGYYSYIKLHDNGMVYTDYNGSLRETWIKTNSGKQQLVVGGGYAITTEVNGQIHMLYNYHFAGNLDARVNLYYMWSSSGLYWFNRHGEFLVLPVAENSQETAISFDYHKFNYLKDIAFVNGEIQALVVQSTSSSPIKGQRELLKFTMDGESSVITNMGHNYDGAKFWKDGIIAIKSDDYGYAGGDLLFYSMDGEYISTLKGEGINYPVRVENSDAIMFADKESNLFIVE
tara:strand:+ start:361 stop:1536 length:1176 start_codon:yes stop_codon:yes gene_type:complete